MSSSMAHLSNNNSNMCESFLLVIASEVVQMEPPVYTFIYIFIYLYNKIK